MFYSLFYVLKNGFCSTQIKNIYSKITFLNVESLVLIQHTYNPALPGALWLCTLFDI